MQIRLPTAENPPAEPESRRAVPRRDLERTGDAQLKVVGTSPTIVFRSVLGRWL